MSEASEELAAAAIELAESLAAIADFVQDSLGEDVFRLNPAKMSDVIQRYAVAFHAIHSVAANEKLARELEGRPSGIRLN